MDFLAPKFKSKIDLKNGQNIGGKNQNSKSLLWMEKIAKSDQL